uniref:SSD domain-containing protein n=1 Tax=Heliothis virescens TaxID=7102 RepID=A0A2A4K8N4_HELVI
MKYLTTIVCFLTLWCSVNARCVVRGECYEVNGMVKPCPADIEAQPLIDGLSEEKAREIVDIFSSICPTLVVDDGGNRLPDNQILTCCTADQVIRTAESLTLAESVLGRCPTCYRNFARQICEMNCATDQSRFVNVTTATAADGTLYVDVIDYRVYEKFMLDAHASCSGVLVPQTGMPAINLMCGNAVICDAEAWFGFTGDTSVNPLAPVQVNFHMSPDKEESMNKEALPCNETFGDDLPCSCVDCVSTCPVGTEPVVPDICTVMSVNCFGFSVGIVFFVISVIIFIVLAFIERSKQNKTADSKESETGPNKLTRIFQSVFAKIGGFSASNPVLIIMLTSWVTFTMIIGLTFLNLTSNPIELWSSPDSRSRQQLNYFNERFGPFYRTAQVFLTFDLDGFEANNVSYGPAFRKEALEELVKLEDAIIDIGREHGGVTLEDVCYAPLRAPGGENHLDYCVSMSASSYLGADRNNINADTYLTNIQNCINNHYSFSCLASWGGGAEPELAFGGFEPGNILSANALLINFPISNFLLEEALQPVLEWELKFIELLHDYRDNWKKDFVSVAFSTERSIEDEIQRVSVAEAVPIAISYILMFIYVTLSLGNIRSFKTWFIDSKIMVALGSILVVVLAIACAMGTLGYANVTLTLLAINVIPFFVLSIGIDNVFLMVNTLHDIQSNLKSFDDYREDFSFEKKRKFVFEKMLRQVGPSMFVSSVTQIMCFAIGTIANFPAVVTFSIFASVSLSFLFVFQITTVIALLSIDYKRASSNRLDLFCCIQKKVLDDENPLHSETPYKGVTQRLMEPYSKYLLGFRVKIVVVIIFMAMVSISVMLIPNLEIGLDQELALPKDSYVYEYLQAVSSLIRMGPPVYFVVKSGLDFTNPVHQNAICGGQLCNSDSLTTQIFLAAQHSNITYISKSSNSWLDDFIDWSSLYGVCCQFNTTDGGFCESSSNAEECAFCEIPRSDYANGMLRPHREAFEKYIPSFLQDPPTEICNKAGLASYSSAVNYVLDSEGRATVHDTNFMAYHSPLSTSKDYITAVDYGYQVADSITAAVKANTGLDVEVFPYSLFYVFFEQYLTMWADTFSSLGYCLIGALFFNLLASGFNLVTTFAVLFNTVLVVLNMMAVMYIWNIPLNAVSCVNLIVSIGISVEFCSHIAYAYATSQRQGGREKVEEAIQKVGATIITGITFTNIPIVVLAFSYTELIEVFFFRMFLSLVVLGFLHGMIFFPVLLCYLDSIKRK